MDSIQFTPSELIYLFLDGEHNGVERSVLFKAMADNQELQHEFEDALKIRSAAFNEAQHIVPPAALTQSLMTRAGFSVAGAAVGSGTSGWLSGVFTHWGSIALMIAIPTITAVGGYFAGSSTLSSASKAIQKNETTTANQDIIKDERIQRLESMLDSQIENVQKLNSSVETLQRANMAMIAGSSKIRSGRPTNRLLGNADGSNSYEARIAANSSADIAGTNQASIHNSDRTSHLGLDLSSPEPEHEGSNSRLHNAVFVSQQSPVYLQQYPMSTVAPAVGSSSASLAMAGNIVPALTFGIRGIRSLSQPLDSLVNAADAQNIANFAINARYGLSSHLQVVAELGRENLVTYDYSNISAANKFPIQQNDWWVGAGMRWTSSYIESIPGTRVFAQGLLAGASSALLIRPLIGVEWQPDARVCFHAGIEGIVIRTQAHSFVNWGLKSALTYGVSVNL